MSTLVPVRVKRSASILKLRAERRARGLERRYAA